MFKTKITFLFLLTFFSSLFPSSITSLKELRETFYIEDDVLISANGTKHHPYNFSSEFHCSLAYILKDLKQTKIIYNAYNKHIVPILSIAKQPTEEETPFQQALLEVCLLFGNPIDSPEEALLCALRHQGPNGEKWIKEYRSVISHFIEDANLPAYPQIIPDNSDYTIAVITTTCSGGNLSLSNALIESLKRKQGIQVIEIDTETIAKECDPMMIATQSLTYDGIYSAIFQQTNDLNIISERKKLNKEIHRYIPSNFLGVLKQKIVDIQPDLIISVRSYTPDDIALSTLGIPFRMMHVDFELCSSLRSYYRVVPTNSIRFWIHHWAASMFKPLFQSHRCLDLYNPKDSPKDLSQKVSSFLHVLPEKWAEQFEVIGYPVSSTFYPIQDNAALNSLREKWGVQKEEIPIFIMMGKHSTAASKEIFDQLLHSKTNLPLRYLFICGKNQKLKKNCENILASFDPSISDKFHIYGLLSPEEINEIMNISALGISKAGASSAMEIMATQSYALLMHSYPWETINGFHLSEMGYAIQYNTNENLIVQIEKGIQLPHKKTKCNIRQWQNQLHKYITELHFHQKHKIETKAS